jgi:polysaccharide deacetylase 2 family uncharacterized protein YibQ
MAQKKAPLRPKAGAGRPVSARRRKKPNPYPKVWWALALLLTVVVAAVIGVRLFLPPHPSSRPVAEAPRVIRKAPAPPPSAPVEAPKTAPRPPAAQGPPPAATVPAAAAPPAYEVFPPAEELPPPALAAPAGPVAERPRVALVIDDMGYQRSLDEAFLALDAPLTVAVLPFSPHGRRIAAAARRSGRQVMLHLPMEPEEYPRVDPGPGALLTQMTPNRLLDQLRLNLEQVPEAVGVNNHMGSRLTQDSDRMNQVFSVLKERGLFFVDSRTTGKSLAYQSARLLNVPFAQRDVFLDHVQDPDFVRRQLDELVRQAEKHGEAIGIGHPHPVTLEVLRERLPAIRQRVELVPASEMARPLI